MPRGGNRDVDGTRRIAIHRVGVDDGVEDAVGGFAHVLRELAITFAWAVVGDEGSDFILALVTIG